MTPGDWGALFGVLVSALCLVVGWRLVSVPPKPAVPPVLAKHRELEARREKAAAVVKAR